jgi:nucleotidyltransferase/DNA polymerase involved in DNA repair
MRSLHIVEAMMIVYLRVVPGFWVAVEESQRPELRSCPLVIGGLPHQRGVVREANHLAQRSGVRPGMTLAQAHQQCPHGVFLMPNLARYELVWENVCEILRRHMPLVEPVEMGQAVCDMSGCERFWSDEWSAGRAIALEIERSTGVTPSLGIASSRLVAQLASMFTETDGVAVIDQGRERVFLADLPLTLLPGVDPRLALTFQVLGLTTISQFAALPASAVKQRFGTTGEHLHRYARGIDPRPVLPPPEKSSIVARYECEDGSIEDAMDGIRTLAETCAGELQAHGAPGKLVGLTLIWAEGPARLSPPREQAGSVEGSEPPALPSPKAQLLPRRSEDERRTFPVPYRVHSSMLPQPLEGPAPQESAHTGSSLEGFPEMSYPPSSPFSRTLRGTSGAGEGPGMRVRTENIGRSQEVVAIVRTPIDTAPPLLERAQQLLLRIWPRSRSGDGDRAPRLLAIELKIGEFTKPSQLSFSDFDRLNGGGTLKGLSAERRQALVRHDEAFEARYGTTAFQHVAAVDSRNILTERRFRWENGLPWNGGEAVRKRS